MDVELGRRIVAQKNLARKNQARRNRIRLVGLLLGTALGVVWFLVAPLNSSKPGSELVIATVGGFVLTDLLIQLRASTLFPERACCPCCGLLMSDLSLFLILKRSESGESPSGRT